MFLSRDYGFVLGASVLDAYDLFFVDSFFVYLRFPCLFSSVCRPFYALADCDMPRTGRREHKFQDATTEKSVIISSGRSDRGGGNTRRAFGHSSLWTPWRRAPLRGPTGQPQRHPACPPCLVPLPRQGGGRNALILATLSRDTPDDTGRDPCN